MNNETPKGKISDITKLMPAESMCRNVYIVDADPDGRHAVSSLLEAARYTVKSFTCAGALLSAVDEKTTGVLILDLSLVDMSGLMLQNELNKRGIGLKTLIISASCTIAASVQAIKGGAVDVIEKPYTDAQLLNSVEEALAEAIADEKKRRQRSALEKRYDRLTRREREIVNFLIRGDTNQKLAERMGLSRRTVEIHRSKIMRKLEATTLPDLVRMVYANGDFQPEEVLVDISRSLRLQKDQAD